MRLSRHLDSLGGADRAISLAIGFFDGVHRGHQKTIKTTIRAARDEKGLAWVLTFDTHPRKVLHPDRAPKLLVSTRQKLQLLKDTGIDNCVAASFTKELSRMEPEKFALELKKSIPGLRRIVVGTNWRFGRGGRGTPASLKGLGARHGFAVTSVPPARWKGKAISSTRIRAAVASGRLNEAARMLGRPFSLLGTVERGKGLGKKLGFPTANLKIHNEATPPNGVFLVRARLQGAWLNGIADLGIRPTTPEASEGPASRLLEVHIFGLRRNLYGKIIEVAFLKKLRGERKFPNLEALKSKIVRDSRVAKRWFARAEKNVQ